MPGIVGCLSVKAFDSALLTAMTKPMLHRSTYRVREHTESRAQ